MKGSIIVDVPYSTRNLSKIIESAVYTRKWCFKQKKRYPWTDQHLTGMCAIASAKLLSALKHEGMSKSRLVCDDSHMAVCIGEDTLVDITISQYDSSIALFIGKFECPMLPIDYFVPVESFATVKSAVKWMKEVGWHIEEIPTTE